MIMKWLGVGLILGSTSLLGIILANRFNERCQLLKSWIGILDLLKTAIAYQSELLPEIFKKISATVGEQDLKSAFSRLARKTGYGSESDVGEVWNQLLAEPAFSVLIPEDLRLLKELGFFLGSTECRDQLAKINGCQDGLRYHLGLAEAERRKKVGLYRYLGFASGAILVLWFI